MLIATASSVLSAQVMASFGPVKAPAFRLHALVSLIPAVLSSSLQPASHLKYLLVLKSMRRSRSFVYHIPTWMIDGRRMCGGCCAPTGFSLGTGFLFHPSLCQVWGCPLPSSGSRTKMVVCCVGFQAEEERLNMLWWYQQILWLG